jgi:hypothetical protein
VKADVRTSKGWYRNGLRSIVETDMKAIYERCKSVTAVMGFDAM